MYSRSTLPDGIKGSAAGEASQSPDPGAKYGGEADRDAKKRKAHRTTRRSPRTTAGENQKRIRTSALLFFREIFKCRFDSCRACHFHPVTTRLQRAQAGVNAWRHHPARCRDCTTPRTVVNSDLPSAGQQRTPIHHGPPLSGLFYFPKESAQKMKHYRDWPLLDELPPRWQRWQPW